MLQTRDFFRDTGCSAVQHLNKNNPNISGYLMYNDR